MRAVVQLVSQAKVKVKSRTIGCIGKGLVVLLGVGKNDTEEDVRRLTDKIIHLRIFADSAGKMNLSLQDIAGEILVVSQFSLYGDCRKGRRPSYSRASEPEKASNLYEAFINILKQKNITVASGQFQAMMEVNLTNDGPVTLLLDSKKEF
jgi:D-tyrosyl-tRNA(Tyr) deacylase